MNRVLNPSNPFGVQRKLLIDHFDRIVAWKVAGDAFPVEMEVNLTNCCNQACRWCISAYSHLNNTAMAAEERRRRRDELARHFPGAMHREQASGLEPRPLLSFLMSAKKMGLLGVAWSGGGEPTCHPRFDEIVEQTAIIGLDQGLMTNGLYPPRYNPVIGTRLRWIRVSLDTLDEQKYRFQKRTTGFPKVIANIHELVRHDVKVGINMNLASWNVEEILSLAEWSRDVGVDYFQIRPILGLPFESTDNSSYRQQLGVDWLQRVRPMLEDAAALSTDTFRVLVSWDKFGDIEAVESSFGRTYRSCKCHFFFCVLNANGDLCVCMYHLHDDRFTFGNIYDDDLENIWKSEKRRRVIEMCADALELSTCQVCCKGHEINKLISSLENPDRSADSHFL